MVHIYKDFFCDTDGIQITLYVKKSVTDKTRAKKENIGKDRYLAIGYYMDVKDMLNAILKQIQRNKIAEADDMSEFKEVLKRISEEVGIMTRFLDCNKILEQLPD